MSRNPRYIQTVALMFLSSGVGTQAWSYHNATHQAINDGAVVRSSVNGYLAEVLGFPEGIATRFNGRDVREWMREAGVFEDQPVTRAANHFHYPLRGWDRALLTDPPGSSVAIQSSVLWAQNPNQDPILGPADTWSWIRARREFLEALTNSSPSKREETFANTFRAVGQGLHLVADGSVPAHARNDSHVSGEPFETWVESQARRRPGESAEDAAARFLVTFAPFSLPFSPAILGKTPNPLAPIPIAKVFDADAYDGTAETLGLTAGSGVGITEVSNANFFSESTIFADRFGITHQRYSPFPASTAVEQFIDPNTNRRYWRKRSPGVDVQHLATVSRLDFFRQLLGGGPPATGGLDPVVHAEYARHLIPRAVGYSAGLLDYFFRGRLQPTFVPDPNGGRELILKTRKLGTEPIGPGSLQLLYDDADGVRRPIQEQPVPDLGGASDLPDIRFDIPEGTPSQYVVVYRGRLGLEEDAVAARVFGGLPIVALQEVAALTGEEFDPGGGDAFRQARRKNPNHQRAEGYFWAGGTGEVWSKIREVRLEQGNPFDGLPPAKAVLRINGTEVATHWRAVDDPGLLPERWEVVLAPIPGQTSNFVVVPPPAIWVNDFRTPLLWIQDAASLTTAITFSSTPDGIPIWSIARNRSTVFHFGDGTPGASFIGSRYPGLDANFVIPLMTLRTRVSFRPVGEVAGLAVPQGEVKVSLETCTFSRFLFLFARRHVIPPPFGPRATCGVGSEVFWAKSFLDMSETTSTVGPQPVLGVAPLLTMATFRREFLEADLERFLSVGIVPPEYHIQTQ